MTKAKSEARRRKAVTKRLRVTIEAIDASMKEYQTAVNAFALQDQLKLAEFEVIAVRERSTKAGA